MIWAVVRKTLLEKRWTIFWWTLGFLVFNFLLIQIFPPMSEAFSSMTDALPPELAGWFGEDGAIWSSLKGFVSLEIVGQMGLVAAIFGVLFGLSMVGAEEQNATLITQMSKPLRRVQYFVAKYLALLIAIVVVMVGFLVGTWLGTLTIDPIALGDLVLPTVAVGLLTLTFGSLAFALTAFGLPKVVAGVVVGVYLFFGYFIAALQGDADLLKFLAALSPFNYYNDPIVMYEGLRLSNVLILLAITFVPIAVTVPVFLRRDFRTN
jgi:ABC-type transport system involved in multi-copper enzyme maturation permease subunit